MSVILGGWHAVGEGNSEGVQGGLPPHRPSCLTRALRVQTPGHQVERLYRGLFVREVAAAPDRSAVAGVFSDSIALVEQSTLRISTP